MNNLPWFRHNVSANSRDWCACEEICSCFREGKVAISFLQLRMAWKKQKPRQIASLDWRHEWPLCDRAAKSNERKEIIVNYSFDLSNLSANFFEWYKMRTNSFLMVTIVCMYLKRCESKIGIINVFSIWKVSLMVFSLVIGVDRT